MNRSERRKQAKGVKKKLTSEQFEQLQKDIDFEYIQREVQARLFVVKQVITEAIHKSLRENGISEQRTLKIVRDMEAEIIRKGEQQRNEQS